MNQIWANRWRQKWSHLSVAATKKLRWIQLGINCTQCHEELACVWASPVCLSISLFDGLCVQSRHLLQSVVIVPSILFWGHCLETFLSLAIILHWETQNPNFILTSLGQKNNCGSHKKLLSLVQRKKEYDIFVDLVRTGSLTLICPGTIATCQWGMALRIIESSLLR